MICRPGTAPPRRSSMIWRPRSSSRRAVLESVAADRPLSMVPKYSQPGSRAWANEKGPGFTRDRVRGSDPYTEKVFDNLEHEHPRAGVPARQASSAFWSAFLEAASSLAARPRIRPATAAERGLASGYDQSLDRIFNDAVVFHFYKSKPP